MSLGCSGYVYGLYAIKGFMEAAGLKNGLLITADPYSKIVDPEDRNTTMLFGDAATATWMVKARCGSWARRVSAPTGPALNTSRSAMASSSNGRQVFNFAFDKGAGAPA